MKDEEMEIIEETIFEFQNSADIQQFIKDLNYLYSGVSDKFFEIIVRADVIYLPYSDCNETIGVLYGIGRRYETPEEKEIREKLESNRKLQAFKNAEAYYFKLKQEIENGNSSV